MKQCTVLWGPAWELRPTAAFCHCFERWVSFVSVHDIRYVSEEVIASNLQFHGALFESPELQQPFAMSRQPGLLFWPVSKREEDVASSVQCQEDLA